MTPLNAARGTPFGGGRVGLAERTGIGIAAGRAGGAPRIGAGSWLSRRLRDDGAPAAGTGSGGGASGVSIDANIAGSSPRGSGELSRSTAVVCAVGGAITGSLSGIGGTDATCVCGLGLTTTSGDAEAGTEAGDRAGGGPAIGMGGGMLADLVRATAGKGGGTLVGLLRPPTSADGEGAPRTGGGMLGDLSRTAAGVGMLAD
jgi:hypothetical protein